MARGIFRWRLLAGGKYVAVMILMEIEVHLSTKQSPLRDSAKSNCLFFHAMCLSTSRFFMRSYEMRNFGVNFFVIMQVCMRSRIVKLYI